jgi:hypothetical protein
LFGLFKARRFPQASPPRRQCGSKIMTSKVCVVHRSDPIPLTLLFAPLLPKPVRRPRRATIALGHPDCKFMLFLARAARRLNSAQAAAAML